jgi:hypothetical protein
MKPRSNRRLPQCHGHPAGDRHCGNEVSAAAMNAVCIIFPHWQKCATVRLRFSIPPRRASRARRAHRRRRAASSRMPFFAHAGRTRGLADMTAPGQGQFFDPCFRQAPRATRQLDQRILLQRSGHEARPGQALDRAAGPTAISTAVGRLLPPAPAHPAGRHGRPARAQRRAMTTVVVRSSSTSTSTRLTSSFSIVPSSGLCAE